MLNFKHKGTNKMKKLTILSIIAAGLLLSACGGGANGTPANNGASSEERPSGASNGVDNSQDVAALDRERNGKCGISKCGGASHPVEESK